MDSGSQGYPSEHQHKKYCKNDQLLTALHPEHMSYILDKLFRMIPRTNKVGFYVISNQRSSKCTINGTSVPFIGPIGHNI